MGFRITREGVGMLLRDLEPSFRGPLPWQRDLYVYIPTCEGTSHTDIVYITLID